MFQVLAQSRDPSVRRILIIDDEEDIREVAAFALEMVAGWQVAQAASGVEGIAVAQAQMPDAIVLDVQMPGMDGPATLRMLREHESLSRIPVLFLTGRVQTADKSVLSGTGATAILAKPFDPLTLAEEIASALGWS